VEGGVKLENWKDIIAKRYRNYFEHNKEITNKLKQMLNDLENSHKIRAKVTEAPEGNNKHWVLEIGDKSVKITMNDLEKYKYKFDGHGNPTNEEVTLEENLSKLILEKFKW